MLEIGHHSPSHTGNINLELRALLHSSSTKSLSSKWKPTQGDPSPTTCVFEHPTQNAHLYILMAKHVTVVMKTINLNLVELVFMQILLSSWDMLVLREGFHKKITSDKTYQKKNCSVWKLTSRKPISLEAKLIHVENLSELILRGHQLLYSQGISDNCFQGRHQQNDFIHWCKICKIWNTPT